MTDLADIAIRLTANGMGSIEVNGEDISASVVGLGLQARVGQPLSVNIQRIAGAVELEGPGIVRLASPSDQRQAIYDFLDRVDALTLDEDVLERATLGESVMGTALAILKEMAMKSNEH